MQTKLIISIILCLVVHIALTANVQAANVSWNVSSGNFSTGASWNPTHFPYSGDTALINNGGTALLGVTAPPNNIGSLKIGSASNNSGTLTQSNQTLTVTGEIWIGNAGGTATYNMSGGTLNAQSWFSVARHYPLSDPTGTVGTVNFSGGTINKSGSGSDVNIGERSGSGAANVGTLNMSGTAVFNVNSGSLLIGAGGGGQGGGQGIMTLKDSAQVNINNTNFFAVGNLGGAGTLTMDGGTINLTTATPNGWAWYPQFLVGYASDGGIASAGYFTMNGGTMNANGWICVGRESGTGTVTINGGTIHKYDTEGDIIIGSTNPFNTSSSAGNGTWNQNGGTVYNPTRLIIGQTGGSGTFNLNGGLIQAAAVGCGVGSSTFNFNGGTLQAVGDQTTYLQGLDNAYVKEGGAIIDTQAYDIMIAQKLRHGGAISRDGGLTKYGPGTLILSALNSYTGDTTVNGGTLEIAGGIDPNGTSLIDIHSGMAVLKTVSVNKTNLNINTAALATFEVADTSHIVGDITGSGTTQVDAGSSLTAQSINQDTLTLGIGARVTIQPIPGGPLALSANIKPVPEPSTLTLLVIGAISLLACTWRGKS